jgi:uncharacterized GH25 family protein
MKKALLLLLSLCAFTALFAHEYVLLAYEFFVKPGGRLEMRLFVADGFNIEAERPLQKAMTRRFELLSERGRADLLTEGREGDLPLLSREVDFRGLGLIHLERDYSRISLPTHAFLDYLRSDNIEGILPDTLRAEQSERYARYLKALVQSEEKPGDSLHAAIVGHHLEIVLLDNPYRLRPSDWLRARVLFMGKPLANKAVTARQRSGSQAAAYQYARTDGEGLCAFKLERGGEWFLHLTHMIPCPDPGDSMWESFWASYSFAVRG